MHRCQGVLAAVANQAIVHRLHVHGQLLVNRLRFLLHDFQPSGQILAPGFDLLNGPGHFFLDLLDSLLGLGSAACAVAFLEFLKDSRPPAV